MQPPGHMDYWPCIALPDSTRCAFCVVCHASCSFQQAGKAKGSDKAIASSGRSGDRVETTQDLAVRQESESLSPEPSVLVGSTSAASEVVILKVEPGQVPNPAATGFWSATPAASASSSFMPGPSSTPAPSGIRDAAGGRLGRQTRTFINQMEHSMKAMGDLCEEIKNTKDTEQLQEIFEDTLHGVRREMGVLENMLKGLIHE